MKTPSPSPSVPGIVGASPSYGPQRPVRNTRATIAEARSAASALMAERRRELARQLEARAARAPRVQATNTVPRSRTR